MNLKDLFGKAEGGVLSYEQFMALANENKAKFVDLSEGTYVSKQKYDDELAARDTRINGLDETIKARDTDLSNLQAQLQAAGGDAEKLAKLGSDFTALQAKYDEDMKAYQARLQEQAYKHAVMDFANSQKFTSQAAKRDFVSSMLAKNLQMEGDTILGATDFVSAYSKDNEDAFVKEGNPPPEVKPHFVDPTTPPGGGTGDVNPFQFNFEGVRPHDKK